MPNHKYRKTSKRNKKLLGGGNTSTRPTRSPSPMNSVSQMQSANNLSSFYSKLESTKTEQINLLAREIKDMNSELAKKLDEVNSKYKAESDKILLDYEAQRKKISNSYTHEQLFTEPATTLYKYNQYDMESKMAYNSLIKQDEIAKVTKDYTSKIISKEARLKELEKTLADIKKLK